MEPLCSDPTQCTSTITGFGGLPNAITVQGVGFLEWCKYAIKFTE